jgi:peptide maturation system protein (TIGR04066 family)
VAPKGLGVDGKDCAAVDGGAPTGLLASVSFPHALEECDAVIAAQYDFQRNERYLASVTDNLIKAMEMGRSVYCTMLLDTPVLERLGQCALANSVDFTYARDLAAKGASSYSSIKQTETPIVMVMGLYSDCMKFEIQLSLRDNFLKKGLRVSQVGSRHYCELFGFHSFPDFMLGTRFSEQEKILAFNSYIRELEGVEDPDLILIGVPDGIMQYSDKLHGNYGITAYEVCCAVTPDYTVLALPCGEINGDYVETLANILKYRNSSPLDGVCMSNANYSQESLRSDESVPCLEVLPDYFVDRAMADYTHTVPVFKSYEPLQMERLADSVYNQLSSSVYKAPM